jgi:Fic family protein
MMFEPVFTYTNEIVRLLTTISAAREIILSAPLIPKWEVTLRHDAIVQSAHSSTSIEGNRLSFEQVSDLAQGREVMATQKDKLEVLNYLKALDNLGGLIKGESITKRDILNIHKILTKNTLDEPSDCGAYRSRYVVVVNKFTGEVSFRPPKNEDVPALIKDLLKWINSNEAEELDPLLEAGIAHYEFVRIHPFVDGNGRTARVLAALILYLRGFDTKQFFCLDDYYDADRRSYYRALQKVEQTSLDLTKWLEYFVGGVAVSVTAVKKRTMRLSSERLRKAKRGQIALTERQMKIVEFINQNGEIKNRDVREMFKISDRAALKEIRKLVDLKVVKSEGQGRSLHYVLA